ncbi:hypothetical protein [Mangrovibacterium diazotrophicum]|uniref:Uncharacterized protein n=1 Tax=Mangrovibacterium diazotrophicum TaxID=1261403 RepID=A0A419W3G5_9BACT|nr:hypothetical protein [Mangrovibacterium diazotrophicum]RKD90015.1 hypothetical protein BC643_0351 [Mangrovibacterium diazotrophicum]
MKRKKIELIHKEQNEDCFEILKSTIIEDKELKEYRIDKDTLLHELPETIVNAFLDFLGTEKRHRDLMLYLIKKGSLVIHCWDDDEEMVRFNSSSRNRDLRSFNRKEKSKWSSDYPVDPDIPF